MKTDWMKQQVEDAKLTENVPDGHFWVQREGDDIVWCRWCGQSRTEVVDWMDAPQCPAKVELDALIAACGEGEG